MSHPERRTIATETSVSGIGLHLGIPVTLTFRPADSGAGITLRRGDRAGSEPMAARVEHAAEAERRTQLGQGETAFHTVEHVLAAATALEIDDLEIVLDGPEPPILDGSALPFAHALRGAGIVPHAGVPDYLPIDDELAVDDGDSHYEVRPAARLELDVTIDFPHPRVGRQRGRYVITPDLFLRDLAPARTFGFVSEVDALRSRGLIRGATTDNVIVLDDEDVVGTTLRWPDEFVRHKALDCIGDLALAGCRLRAQVVVVKPSHRGTVALVRALAAAASRS
ncbi:MAG: hypothetical protein NVS9B3_03330 [Gemmatimonadaceae bacterium]